MSTINPNQLKLKSSYLFSGIAKQVAVYRKKHPERRVISLGIGDVSRPLAPAITKALHQAVDEMGQAESFRGYGPEQGYAFLREAIAAHDYQARGARITADEIFVSDGAKSDLGNFQELFSLESIVAVTDPVYPVYVDANVMAGRAGDFSGGRWSRLVSLPCVAENDFVPEFPDTGSAQSARPDFIYLCSPNNPTGTALSRPALQAWVDYARRENCVLLFDSAYEAFIQDDETKIPHSIYELPGAEEVAVEFRSFSKTAGFTGLRCAYTVVPRALLVDDGAGHRVSLHELWFRRQSTKYNGCPYIVQRAAGAVYSPEGQGQIRETLSVYQHNARELTNALSRMGLQVYGGKHAPYLWVKTPGNEDSWAFFARLLENAALVCTPGKGFGAAGEGYVRLTAFASPEDTAEAIARLQAFAG